MKIIAAVLGAAFLIIAWVMISLVRSGGALKPAGLIKPAEIGADFSLIEKQIAIRLYPDFRANKHVIWRLEGGAEALAEIPHIVLANYQIPTKPTLQDLRGDGEDTCAAETCWYILGIDNALPDSVAQKAKAAPTAEIFVQYFDRDEKVPEACENEKIVSLSCIRPISVREVRRKIKTSAPHFFMQRYQKSQFYLFIEKKS